MGKTRRIDPLERDRAALRAMRRQRERREMSQAEIERRMLKIIRQKLSIGEPIHHDDFMRANVPTEAINPNFGRLLAAVQSSIAAEGK